MDINKRDLLPQNRSSHLQHCTGGFGGSDKHFSRTWQSTTLELQSCGEGQQIARQVIFNTCAVKRWEIMQNTKQ